MQSEGQVDAFATVCSRVDREITQQGARLDGGQASTSSSVISVLMGYFVIKVLKKSL